MLILALLLTLVGFGLLVASLMMTNLVLAWACIVACFLGLVLLVADWLERRREHREELTVIAEDQARARGVDALHADAAAGACAPPDPATSHTGRVVSDSVAGEPTEVQPRVPRHYR